MVIKYKHRFDGGGGAGKINLSALGQATGSIGGVFGTLLDAAAFDPSTMGAEDRAYLEAMNDLDFNATDYGDLYAQVSGLSPIENNFKASDYYKEKSGLDYFLDFNKDTLAGAGTGASIGGPWGALIGGIVGSASNIAGSIWGHNKKKESSEKAAEDNMALADSINKALSLKISNSANNLNTQNVSNMLLHTGAFGGALETKGANWKTGATFIENGGTHEQNPNEGVQFGISSDGLPNLVEEGEVIVKLNDNTDYVLSNREFGNLEEIDNAKITDNPNRYLGKSYAEIYKDLFERNHLKDVINRQDTKDYIASLNERIAKAQENTKQREFMDDLAKLTPEQREYLLQQMNNPNLLEEAAYAAKGGKIYIRPENRGKFNATKKRTGKTTEELTHSKNPLTRKRAIFAQNAKKWKHSDGGHLFVKGGFNDYPFGAIGTGVDYMVNGNPYQNILDKISQEQLGVLNTPNDMLSWQPDGKGDIELMAVTNPIEVIEGASPKTKSVKSKTNTINSNEDNYSNYTYPTWMRTAAPIAGNLIGLGYTLAHKPDNKYADEYEQAAKDYANTIREIGYTPISEKLPYKHIDTAYYINELLASQAANRNALINLSNGNPNVTAANLLASNYNSNIELGKLMKEGEEANWNRLKDNLIYNRETDKLNRDAAMQAAIQNANIRTNKANTLLNAKLRALGWRRDDIANWENNLGSNLTNLFDNLGNIGLENYNRNTMISNLALYYYTDEDGTMHYKKGLSKKQKEIAKNYAKENNLEVKG